MKIATALLLVTFTASAHAEMLVPKGAKGTLTVEYVFTSAGKYSPPSKETIDIWSVKRNVTMTTQYAADPPQAVGTLHQDDPKQKAEMAAMQAKTASAHKKLEPMQNDVMAMAAKCGITMDGPDVSAAEEKAQEACMEKAAAAYGNNMEMTPEIKSAGADIAAVNKTMSGTRFQLWRSTSQSGTYSIDETISKQVFEMTCTTTTICKRVVTNKGGGAIPGGKSAGASMIEVDSTGNDMVLQLPMPAAPLPITKTVTTTMIDDDAKGGPTFASLWPSNSKPITVKIPGDLKTVSGTQTTTIPGDQSESGTLTVNWKFTRQ
jgi:hypothetical protein